MTRVTSPRFRASSPFFPSKSQIPQSVPSRRKVAEVGTARERGCEIGEGAACWIELALAAASSSLFLRKEALRPQQPLVPARLSLTLAEICCRGVSPSRTHSFPPALGLGMPSGQRVCQGLRPAPDLYCGDLSETWKTHGCRGAASRCPCLAHPRPAHAHAHVAGSLILHLHSQVSVCSGT